jgi:hypothetical protein
MGKLGIRAFPERIMPPESADLIEELEQAFALGTPQTRLTTEAARQVVGFYHERRKATAN